MYSISLVKKKTDLCHYWFVMKYDSTPIAYLVISVSATIEHFHLVILSTESLSVEFLGNI